MANRRMLSKRISVSTRVNVISDFAKLLFTWIIPHTDDWGRLDGEPQKVKAIVMPLSKRREKDFDNALEEMAKVGLIVWYAVDNSLFLQISAFEDHQSKLEKRTSPKYPDIPKNNKQGYAYPATEFNEIRRNSAKLVLNLTKPNLTKPNLTLSPVGEEGGPANLISLWNDFAVRNGLSQVTVLSDDRQRKLKTRFNEPAFRDNFPRLLENIAKNDFLLGRSGGRGWKISFDFLIDKEKNYLKVLEGVYEQGGNHGKQAGVSRSEVEEFVAGRKQV